ncbi:hypothetical protein D3C86_1838900 [compost metagenome]
MRVVAVAAVTGASMPLKRTMSLLGFKSKFEPVRVMVVPTEPVAVLSEARTGTLVVKFAALEAVPIGVEIWILPVEKAGGQMKAITL